MEVYGYLLREYLEGATGASVLSYNLDRQRYFCCHTLSWGRVADAVMDGFTPLVTYTHFGQFWDWYEQEHLGCALEGVVQQYLWMVLAACDLLVDLSLTALRGVHCIWVAPAGTPACLGLGFTPLILPCPDFYAHFYSQFSRELGERFRHKPQSLKTDWQTELKILHWRGYLWRQLAQIIN